MNVPSDIIDFMLRWRKKSRQYDYNRLNHCFDGFFTIFVLYNFLYDLICEYDRQTYPQQGDRRRATDVVVQFLGGQVIASDKEIRTNAFLIKKLVENGIFCIRASTWDRTKVADIENEEPTCWAVSLLEILYQVRCNTFHGQKPFLDKQKEILVPCIKTLQRICDMLIDKIAPGHHLQPARNTRI